MGGIGLARSARGQRGLLPRQIGCHGNRPLSDGIIARIENAAIAEAVVASRIPAIAEKATA
jgi:hypothetical protein